MRKSFFARLVAYLVCIVALSPEITETQTSDNSYSKEQINEASKNNIETFGAWENPDGDKIGGGHSYSKMVSHGDFIVQSLDELLDALENAANGQIVYIKDDTVIDLTGQKNVVLPGGVTLASGRNGDSSNGALLYTIQLDTMPLFVTGGENVRITGLRLRGPDQERRTEQLGELMLEGGHRAYYRITNSDGIQALHSGLEVDNCELWGWSHAAIFLKSGATEAHIHHNYIHHNQRSGLGYGVCLDQANALIEANLFDWCRHHIAGTGRPGTSYEACHNIVFEHANGHSFDMHGGKDRSDGTDIAGDSIIIHHNTFFATDVSAFVIRGVPTEKAEIHHNWFLHKDSAAAVKQTNANGNMKVYSNQYTTGRLLKD
ncbi:MAG: right-handed parallel beta-helix repeat-containing protein [Candidatus Latescibacteria bacterium]|nr:right-handed parallel beta-helix repeat-containing protein [Candidatus Latescibacterota bacterium]